MWKKRMTGAVIVLVLLVSVTACGAKPLVEKPTTIHVWTMPVFTENGGAEMLNTLITDFQTATKNVTVELTVLDLATAGEKLKEAKLAGQGPDVFFGDLYTLTEYYGTEGYQDLAPLLAASPDPSAEARTITLPEALLTQGKMGGESLGFYPVAVQPYLMAYNKTLLETAGVLADLPIEGDRSWTTAEYLAFSAKLRAGLPAAYDVGYVPYGSTAGDIATKSFVVNAGSTTMEEMSGVGGAKGLDVLKVLLKNNLFAADAITLKEDIAQPNVLVNGLEMTAETAKELFLEGKSAQTFFYSMDMDLAEGGGFEVIFMPYPSDTTPVLPYELMGAAAFAQKDEMKALASRLFVDYLANSSAYHQKVPGFAGAISPNSDYNGFLQGEYAYLAQTVPFLGDYRAVGYEPVAEKLAWIDLLRSTLFEGMDSAEALALYATNVTTGALVPEEADPSVAASSSQS